MFIEKTFAPETLDVLRLFKRQSTCFAGRLNKAQRDLPIDIGAVEDKAAFKQPMPDRKHHEFFAFDQTFHPNGSPKNPALAPITEFCRIILELERQSGFNLAKSRYDLNGRTEDRSMLNTPAAMQHCDGGNPLVRVYLLSDEVAPTRFGMKKTSPFHIYFFSGKTKHQAWIAEPEFRDLPHVPRNIAHLRIQGGVDNRFFPALR